MIFAPTREKILYETKDDLINKIFNDYQQQKEAEPKTEFKQLLWNYDLEDKSILLTDTRTLFLGAEFEFYQNTPHIAYDSQIWFEVVRLFNKMQPRLI